jgi:hypothetical protein
MQDAYSRVVRSAYYYKVRSEEVRTVAEQTRDPWCRKVLNAVAEDYARLAGDRLNEERRAERAAACALRTGIDPWRGEAECGEI